MSDSVIFSSASKAFDLHPKEPGAVFDESRQRLPKLFVGDNVIPIGAEKSTPINDADGQVKRDAHEE